MDGSESVPKIPVADGRVVQGTPRLLEVFHDGVDPTSRADQHGHDAGDLRASFSSRGGDLVGRQGPPANCEPLGLERPAPVGR